MVQSRQLIKDFKNYLITFDGRVFSLKSNKYLKLRINSDGYYVVGLYKDGKQYQKSIARLIVEAFIPNPNNKPEVNHKDGIKSNNIVFNLEWVTAKENTQHAKALGFRENNGKRKIAVKVYDYKTDKYISIHPSISDAARTYGLNPGSISSILTGNRKQIKGLTFNKVCNS